MAEHSDGDEQDLVVRLRKSHAFIPELSLIAETGNENCRTYNVYQT